MSEGAQADVRRGRGAVFEVELIEERNFKVQQKEKERPHPLPEKADRQGTFG